MNETLSHDRGLVAVALTGSGTDRQAVDWAADDAAARSLPLRIVHTAGVGVAGTETEAIALEAAEERANLRQPALVVTTGTNEGGNDHGRSVVVITGLPSSERITDDVIRSVLHQVGGFSRCPVVIVRAMPGPGPVVAGVDPRRDGGVLEFAFAHAARHGLGLRVVHARTSRKRLNFFRVERAYDTRHPNEDIEVERRTNTLTVRYPTVRVDVREARRHPREALARESQRAGLLVLGTPGRKSTAAQLGPFGHRALVNVPVIAVVSDRTEKRPGPRDQP